MPFPLFNSIASWFLKKRIHQIELFLKYPVEVQQEVLMDLISFAKILKLDTNMILIQLRTIPSLKKEFQLGLTKK